MKLFFFDHFTHYHCVSGMNGYDLRDNLDPVYTANGTYSTHLFADKVVDIVNKHQGDKVCLGPDK